MRTKLCLYIMLLLFSPLAQAEYYLVYGSPSPCCGGGYYVAREYPRSHHVYRHHRHHRYHQCQRPAAHHSYRRSSYTIEEYYVYNSPCGGCGCYGGCGQVVYTTRPSSCVTYDEVVNGTQYYDRSYYDDPNDP